MDTTERRDEALFEAISRKKKKRKQRIIRTIVIIVVLAAVLGTAGVLILRRKVAQRFASGSGEVLSAEAGIGSISTQVSGSGTLMNVDEESITLPAGVTVDEVLVSANDSVTEGELLVRVDTATVLTAMSALQDTLDSLDSEISSAMSDTVSSYISAGVAGRVKKVYAAAGQDVVSCMYEHGALALLSLDGYMAVEIDAGTLQEGDPVTIRRADGTELGGTVDSVLRGKATVLVSDNGPEVDETVTVLSAEGKSLGEGKLCVHSPLRVSGVSGKISYAYASENQQVYAGSTMFVLSDTSYSARYQTLLRQREEQEDTLLELMNIYRSGGVTAPFSGSVSVVDYDETTVTADTETALVTMSPDESMQISMNVDESNILSLEVGQSAQITVSSIGDDVFEGKVTEISKTANSASGVTRYAAVITLKKTPEMLQGMSAKIVIRIQGVENAVIIPIEALHQTSSTSYVYTEYDEEMKEFGGLVTVTVGITNSSYAEITSGLKEGDTVWYTKSTAMTFSGMPNMPGGTMGGGFGMPGGGTGTGGFGSGMPGGSGGNFGGSMPGSAGGGNFGGRQNGNGGGR